MKKQKCSLNPVQQAIPVQVAVNTRPEWERITQNRAAILLNIDRKQLHEWERAESDILKSIKVSCQVSKVGLAKCPDMEAQLYLKFMEMRQRGRTINHTLFQRQGRETFEDLYSEQIGFDQHNQVVFD